MAYFINNYGKSPEVIFHIDIINIKPTTGFVRIVIWNDAVGSNIHDYLSFIKLDKGWDVIENIFHQFDNVSSLNNQFFIK